MGTARGSLVDSVAAAMVKALKFRRLKRRELARRLGVSAPYVTAVLRGDKNLTLGQVVRVLDALRFRLDVRIVRAKRPTRAHRTKKGGKR